MKSILLRKGKRGGRALIVGTVSTLAALRRVVRARSLPCDLVEVRLDAAGEETNQWLDALRATKSKVPVLLTVRSAAEGGGWQGSEKDRAGAYDAGLSWATAIDIEIGSAIAKKVAGTARRRGRTVIGSFHDFKGTPTVSAMRKIVAKGIAAGADIVKIATRVRAASDIRRLLELLWTNPGVPLCLIGMGAKGRKTRVLFPLVGSCLAYGYIDRSAAPGQLSCRELRQRL